MVGGFGVRFLSPIFVVAKTRFTAVEAFLMFTLFYDQGALHDELNQHLHCYRDMETRSNLCKYRREHVYPDGGLQRV